MCSAHRQLRWVQLIEGQLSPAALSSSVSSISERANQRNATAVNYYNRFFGAAIITLNGSSVVICQSGWLDARGKLSTKRAKTWGFLRRRRRVKGTPSNVLFGCSTPPIIIQAGRSGEEASSFWCASHRAPTLIEWNCFYELRHQRRNYAAGMFSTHLSAGWLIHT